MMLSLELYLQKMELNNNDPDYQIEEFWYGFKNSIKNFSNFGLKVEHSLKPMFQIVSLIFLPVVMQPDITVICGQKC